MSKRPTKTKKEAPQEPPQPTVEMVQAASALSQLAQAKQWYLSLGNAPLSKRGRRDLQAAFLRIFMEE